MTDTYVDTEQPARDPFRYVLALRFALNRAAMLPALRASALRRDSQ
jgi:hypothetical protein